jgi:hypothetical protein
VTADTAEAAQDHPRPGVGRERSIIKFCYEDLSSAQTVVKALHSQYGGRATYDQIAAELQSSPISGAFRNKVSAARLFGFVTVERQGFISSTALGTSLLDERTASDAKAEGFLHVPLYAQLYDRFRNSTLPGDKGLENVIREMGVAAKQVVTARQVFQRSAQQAGYFRHGRDRLVKPPRGIVTESGYAEERTDERQEEGQPGMQADPLLASLFQKLPPKDEGFSKSQRDNFVTALNAIFTLVYGPDDEERTDGRTGTQPTGSRSEPTGRTSADTTGPQASAPSAAPRSAELRAS